MPEIDHSALVAYTPLEMFKLVNDVDAYQHFVPWCLDSRVLEHTEQQLMGQLSIGQAGIKKTFVTCNTLHPPHQIDINLIEGPFKNLTGHWRFQPLGNVGCKICLNLVFEFSSNMLEQAFALVFNKVSNALVTAFCQRAETVYGPRLLP